MPAAALLLLTLLRDRAPDIKDGVLHDAKDLFEELLGIGISGRCDGRGGIAVYPVDLVSPVAARTSTPVHVRLLPTALV